jgi:hypothetical protein
MVAQSLGKATNLALPTFDNLYFVGNVDLGRHLEASV